MGINTTSLPLERGREPTLGDMRGGGVRWGVE